MGLIPHGDSQKAAITLHLLEFGQMPFWTDFELKNHRAVREYDVGKAFRLCCNTIRYRQGYVEVTAGIHDGLVNLEAWDIAPEVEVLRLALPDQKLWEEAVVGNTELELTPAEARRLASALSDAADAADRQLR